MTTGDRFGEHFKPEVQREGSENKMQGKTYYLLCL